MSVLGLHHAGVHVADLERSIAFYGEVFGLRVVERFAFGGEELAFLSVGSARLELIQSESGQRTTGVVDHVALRVDDLDALLGRLRTRGVTVLDLQPVPVPQLQARIAFCLGPDAERIELVEYQA
jgi:lactoylglutathione lyase